MSEEANTLSAAPIFFFTPETHSSTDSSILCPEFSKNSAGLDTTLNPIIDEFSSGWSIPVLGQQQQYQSSQSYQQQSQRQHTQWQHGQDWTLSQVPDRQVSCTLTSPSLTSTAGVSGIRPTSPYDADWPFLQAPHHTSFASMIDGEGRHIVSRPDLEQLPAVETRSTLRERSNLDVAKQ